MRSPLKEKIKNAINRAILVHDSYSEFISNGDGALIVGGRRRNRKKKKKQNGQKKKKTHNLENIKTRLSPKGCRKGDKQQENAPLITDIEETKDDNIENEEDYDKTNGIDEISNAEKVEEKTTEDYQNLSDGGHDDDEDRNIQTVLNDSQEQEIVNEEIISEDAHATHSEPSVNIKSDDDDHSHRVQFAKETQEVDESQPSLMQSQGEEVPAIKTEDSPLIEKDKETSDDKGKKGKDSKFKDQQPGVLCCTIL